MSVVLKRTKEVLLSRGNWALEKIWVNKTSSYLCVTDGSFIDYPTLYSNSTVAVYVYPEKIPSIFKQHVSSKLVEMRNNGEYPFYK